MMASGGGHPEIVKMLLRAGADVNMKAVEGETALSVAKEEGHSEVVQLLKAAGAR
jgi:ankyrin repeat protein